MDGTEHPWRSRAALAAAGRKHLRDSRLLVLSRRCFFIIRAEMCIRDRSGAGYWQLMSLFRANWLMLNEMFYIEREWPVMERLDGADGT